MLVEKKKQPQLKLIHSLPRHREPALAEYLFNVSSDKKKKPPQAINHPAPFPFISLHQITCLLTKWTAPPSGEIYRVYFLLDKMGRG